ncbi:hypothetical protein [Rhodohalobacter sp. 614A]|uniref:hypothetical protein n=1 Tax=Rhodohalobacter sp. 614A TaxID=2908649 RepID=UPI001F29BD82|nr:hypothetical protein [Rhodohalobacter sp. 614A]
MGLSKKETKIHIKEPDINDRLIHLVLTDFIRAIQQARQMEGDTHEPGIYSGVPGDKSPARIFRPAGLYSGNPTNPTNGGRYLRDRNLFRGGRR